MDKEHIKQFFKSEADMYIFILLYTDSSNRMKLLGVEKDHYYDELLAAKWYRDIFNILTTDPCSDLKERDRAIEKLRYLYCGMTIDCDD